MKVGDLVRYTERTCHGFGVESSFDIVEEQMKIDGHGVVLAAGGALDYHSPETVVVWWPEFGETWEPADRLEIISEA